MIETNNPILGLIEFLRQHRRQAEIRELYDEVEKLKQSQGQATVVQPEEPAPIILSPVINNLDNSDFRLSVSDYNPATTITDPCDVLDKWYRWVDSEDGYSVHGAAASQNAITKTSDEIEWDAAAGVLVIKGGYRFSTKLFRNYASTSGNNLYFGMTVNHIPFGYGVYSFVDDGLVTCLYTTAYGQNLENGMTVQFPSITVDDSIGKYIKPDSVQFFEPMEILDITPSSDVTLGLPGAVPTVYKSFTCRLRKLGENDYVRSMGNYIFNPLDPVGEKKFCQIRSMPHPDIKLKVSVLEEKSGFPGEQVPFPESSEISQKAVLEIIKPFGKFYGFSSVVSVGTLIVPSLTEEIKYSGKEQWLEVQIMKQDGSPASALDLPTGTFTISNISLSTAPGPWAESARDTLVEKTCNLTATSTRVFTSISGGRGGNVYSGGEGGVYNPPTRQVDPSGACDPTDPVNPWRITLF